MLDNLLYPFQFEFFRTAMFTGALIGALCGLIGVFIVLRNMSYIGHGLSHAIFGGAAVAYVSNASLTVWAGLWGFAAALLINFTVRRFKIAADAAIGVVTTASFAIGIAIISSLKRFSRDIEAFLFGSIVAITPEQVSSVIIVGIIVCIGLFLLYKQMLFTTFDEETAQIYGVPTIWVDTLFSLALAAVLIVSMQVIGVTLIAAEIVIPPITARMLTNRFDRMLFYSVFIGMITAAIGVFSSYHLNVSSGAAIVLFQASLFVVVLMVRSINKRRTVIAQGFHNHA